MTTRSPSWRLPDFSVTFCNHEQFLTSTLSCCKLWRHNLTSDLSRRHWVVCGGCWRHCSSHYRQWCCYGPNTSSAFHYSPLTNRIYSYTTPCRSLTSWYQPAAYHPWSASSGKLKKGNNLLYQILNKGPPMTNTIVKRISWKYFRIKVAMDLIPKSSLDNKSEIANVMSRWRMFIAVTSHESHGVSNHRQI